jgi:cytochrome c
MVVSGKALFAAVFAVATLVSGLGPAQAGGDPVVGEKVSKKCVACHSFEADGGGKLGPHLFAVIGRPVGGLEGYDNFSDSYVALGQGGAVWTEENLVAYLKDPKAAIREWLGDPKAKSKMTFKLPGDQDIADVIAYMATLK